MKLLYFAPSARGGIADYAHEQIRALTALGADVTLLCTAELPVRGDAHYRRLSLLMDSVHSAPSSVRALRKAHFARSILHNFSALARVTESGHFQHVLMESYLEYLAPLWNRPLLRLAARGVVFGAVVHDPVRNYVVGPPWWHRWSIACGYSFLREAFVHEAIALDTGRPMPQLHTSVIPQGIYERPPATRTRSEMRAELDIPASVPLMLAFGSIRDDKNIDLAIRAMVDAPAWHLLVAGNTISSGSRPASYYRELAESLGVADRCHWRIQFIPDSEIGDLFAATDIVLLTYGASFRSHSGVLNTAAAYRTVCLASGGEGAMRTAVQSYGLGVWAEPGSVQAIADGLRRWPAGFPAAEWERYHRESSWTANARLTLDALAATR